MKTIAICIAVALLGAASVDLVSVVALAQSAPVPAVPQPQTYTVTLSSNEPGVSEMTGGGTFATGSTVTITFYRKWVSLGQPFGWYRFNGWFENGQLVTTDDRYTFKLTSDRKFSALVVPY